MEIVKNLLSNKFAEPWEELLKAIEKSFTELDFALEGANQL